MPQTGKARGPFSLIRQRFSGRPDTEHEQALIRLVIGTLLFFYFLLLSNRTGSLSAEADRTIAISMLWFLLLALMLCTHIVVYPGASRVRRLLGATLDTGTVSYMLIQSSASAIPLYFLYLWIILGHGFRFGRGNLLYALTLSLTGFGAAIVWQPYWAEHRPLGVGLWLGMLLVSLYASSLHGRLEAALKQAEAANLAKRRFVSTVSHELRTPLNAIIGMSSLLQNTRLNEEQTDMLQSLDTASKAMLSLVEDVLDFSKIEAGKLSSHLTQFDLHALVAGTGDMFKYQASARGLTLDVRIDAAVPAVVWGDPRHLRQVLANLLSNAVKFTHAGGVVLRVRLRERLLQEVILLFEVEDSGIGIPAEAQSVIFESFTQADDSTSRRYGGTGLGTTISRQLVELMGGKLELRSTVGVGSVFSFSLTMPLQVNGVRPPEEEGNTVDVEPAGARYHVLVAEDEPLNSKVIRKVLERAGHHCLLVDNGRAALDLLGRHEFDAAIFDMNMPVMDGLEAAKAYQAMTPAFARIPIIMFSASVSTEERSACLAAGIADFVSKPIQTSLLMAALDRVTAGRPRAYGGIADEQDGVLPVLDHAALNSLGQMGDAFLDDLLLTFVQDNRARLARLEELYTTGDLVEFRKVLHTLIGSAATLGAKALVANCKAIEKLPPDEMRAAAADALPGVRAGFENVCDEIQRYRAANKPA
jgi:two-component system sensor histidine kinase RpfC